MGICCASYCTDNKSFIDDANSFSSNVPVLPIVSETTSYYEDYQENLRKTRQNESRLKPCSTTRKNNQSNLILFENENEAPQTLINQPITVPGATSTRNLNANFNTSGHFEASTLNRRDNLISINQNPQNNLQNKPKNWQLGEWKQEPQRLLKIENLEASETEKDEQPNFPQTPNSPKLFKSENLKPETKKQEQTFLETLDSPKLFERENIEAATNKEIINGLNSPRLESIRRENLESETTKDFLERLTKQKVVRNLELINDLRAAFNLNHLETFPEKPYQEEQLEALKYTEVENIFTMNMSYKRCFTISNITAITNIFLELHFKLNMEIYKKRNPEQLVNDSLLFHGTKLQFLKRICTYNFDRTKVCTHKFGHGVSFARKSSYATHYHYDNKRKYQKVMIIAKALLEEKLPLGTQNTVVPPEPYYTSRNGDASVIVKYDDASFYPLFIIYYSGFHPPKRRPLRY